MKLQLYVTLFALLPAAIKCEKNGDVEKSHTLQLTSETFYEALQTNNFFVKFYAPWCGHCKRLHPLWEELAQIMNKGDESEVVIAKVDCTQHQELCSNHEVTGYPTLRFFKRGENESVKFKGTRDMPAIKEFLNQQLRSLEENEIPNGDKDTEPDSKSTLIELTDANFARHVSSGKHFVKFYAPWCSHCQHLAPTWEELSKTFEHEKSFTIAKIDCTVYRPICQEFEVRGYPTLLWIEDGKKIEKYSGSRDHDELHAYVEKMLGTDAKQEVLVEEEPSDVQLQAFQLTGEDFKKTIQDGVVFVKFYAPWCGHCQKMSPTWDHLAKAIHSEQNGIKIAKVDCTATENTEICLEQQIEGYPSLFAYKHGVKQSEYDGTRSLPELQYFIKKFVAHDEL